MSIITSTETTTTIDADGNESTSIIEKSTNFQRNNEPDYIKLYTRMWCEFNEIPEVYRGLFLELVTRMSYACTSSEIGGQLVNTGKPWSDDIMKALNWKKAMYQRGLKALCECDAIRKVGRGVYQINPNYAGRGEWKYNPRLQRGGVEDLVVKFSFKDKDVQTSIVWADDGTDSDFNDMYREGMGVSKEDETVLKHRRCVS